MRKLLVAMSVISIIAALFLTGCSSGGGGGSTGGWSPPPTTSPIPQTDPPTPTPDPTDPPTPDPPDPNITVKISGTCLYPDGEPIVGATADGQPGITTGANGKFEGNVTVPKGEAEYTIQFSKTNFIFDELKFTLSGSNPTYIGNNDKIIGFVPMSKGTKYRVSTPAITPYSMFTSSIALSPDGKFMYASIMLLIYRIDLNTMTATVIAGANGATDETDGVAGNQAKFLTPIGMVVSPDGTTLYVADSGLYKIKKITGVNTATSGSETQVYTMAGTGTSGLNNSIGSEAMFRTLRDLTISSDGNILYVCDNSNYCVRKITGVKNALSATNTQVSTIAGTGTIGHLDDTGNLAQFYYTTALVLSKDDATMYVTDTATLTASFLRKITGLTPDATSANVTVYTLAGYMNNYNENASFPITGNLANFKTLSGLALSEDEDTIFITDTYNHRIKIVKGIKTSTTASATTVDLFLGTGVTGKTDGNETVAQFNQPLSLQLTKNESVLYVNENQNPTIRRIVATE